MKLRSSQRAGSAAKSSTSRRGNILKWLKALAKAFVNKDRLSSYLMVIFGNELLENLYNKGIVINSIMGDGVN